MDVFMKSFLDNIIVSNDQSTHISLKKYFLKCQEFGVSLKSNKCAFMVFSKTILGFIVSKKGKIMELKRLKP